MKIKSLVFLVGIFFFNANVLYSQVGIGTTTPKALLDILSSDSSNPTNTDGILIPRINIFPTTNPTEEQNGLLVWLNNTIGTNLPGFYYWDKNQNQWVGIASNIHNKGWDIIGNRGTNSTNYIGTLDANALQFKVNNQVSGRIDYGQKLNTSFGYQTLSNQAGERNTAFGYQNLSNNTSGGSNTAIGYHSLKSNDRGWENTSLGNLALFSNTYGSRNTATGYYSMYYNLSSEGNTASGVYSLHRNTIGSNNTVAGSFSLFGNETGSNNTAIGYSAAKFFEGDNAISIGNYSGGNLSSNEASIGNSSISRIYGQVNWSSFSDARIKDDIAENVPGLAFIKALRPVTYNLNIHNQDKILHPNEKENGINWKGKYDIEKIKQTGFIAQEVEQAAQKLNYSFSGVQAPKGQNKLYTISYASFVVPLVKAVQEQQKEIETQNEKIKKLESENKNLEQRLKRLEQLIK